MTDAAPPEGTPPAVPPATPPAPPANPPAATVTLTKEEHDRLVGRASGNQSKADRYDRLMKQNGGHFKPAAPATPPSPEEAAQRAADEDRKAERGLMALAVDPAFREVLDSDATLREMLTKNPLAVLPVMANDAIDAEDAVALVRDALTKRAEGLKKPATPPANPPTPPTPPTPPAGGVNPPDKPLDAEYEAARKIPNTEKALSEMIKVGIKRQNPQKT